MLTTKNIYAFFSLGLLLIVISACEVIKITPADTTAQSFIKFFGGTEDDYGQEIIMTDDGGFLLLGTLGLIKPFDQSFEDDTDEQFYLVKTDAGGNLQWDHQFGEDGLVDEPKRIVTSGSDIYMLGSTFNPDSFTSKAVLARYTGSGAPGPNGIETFNITGFKSSTANDILVDNGNIWIFGSYTNDPDLINHNLAIWRVSLTGGEIKIEETLLGGNPDLGDEESATAFAQRPGGGFVVLADIEFQTRIMLISANGEVENTVVMDNEDFTVEQMKVDAQGNIYLLGAHDNLSNQVYQLWAQKLNPDLSQVWPGGKIIGPDASGSYAFSGGFSPTSQGGMVITGYLFVEDPQAELGFHSEILLSGLDATGNFMAGWPEEGYHLMGDTGDDYGTAVIPIEDGGQLTGIVLTGAIGFGPTSKMVLIKTDETGSLN